MARSIVIVLWLLTSVWLLGSAGCKKAKARLPTHEEPANPQTLPEKDLSLWQCDIDQYRLHTKDPQALRPQAEEFMRARSTEHAAASAGAAAGEDGTNGKEATGTGPCQDLLVETYYGRAVCRDQGSYPALPILAKALNAWPQSDYPPEIPETWRVHFVWGSQRLRRKTAVAEHSQRSGTFGGLAQSAARRSLLNCEDSFFMSCRC